MRVALAVFVLSSGLLFYAQWERRETVRLHREFILRNAPYGKSDFQKRMRRIGMAFQGTALTFGLALSPVMRKAVQTFAEFAQTLERISVTTGLSGEELRRMYEGQQ